MALNLNDRNDLREEFILVPDLIGSSFSWISLKTWWSRDA